MGVFPSSLVGFPRRRIERLIGIATLRDVCDENGL